VATLPSRNGAGPPLRLTGKIDRLVHTGTAVLIVDYKTNRPPPRAVAEVAETYLLQLAAYRLGIAAIFPGLEIRAALLWTDGARIMEIPRLLLDEHAQRLWTGGLASLDA
jgi:ATP-dependent helicase/nuclease subunit A